MTEHRLSPLFTWRSAIVKSDLPSTQRHVALTLSLHMNEIGESCYPSLKTLANETDFHKETVKDAVDGLEGAGFLVVDRRGPGRGKTNIYSAAIPETFEIRVEKGRIDSDRGVDLRSDALSLEGERSESPSISDAEGLKGRPLREKVGLTEEKGRSGSLLGRHEDVKEDVVGPTSSEVVPLLPPDWGEFEFMRKICIELEAEDFLDLAYWQDIDKFLEGTQVYYDEVFKRYIDWWNDQPPSARHRNRKKAFKTWIRKDEARDRRRQRGLEQKQSAGGRR
jgi:hypothetical protein